MTFSVSQLRLIRQMVLSANAKDWKSFSTLLHKRQPHFASIIDEVGEDPRCYDCCRFCTLFCSIALERAGMIARDLLPVYPKYAYQNYAALIARGQEKQIGKRAVSFPGRIRRYVLFHSNFDEDDARWQCTTISAFLMIIEKRYSCKQGTRMS